MVPLFIFALGSTPPFRNSPSPIESKLCCRVRRTARPGPPERRVIISMSPKNITATEINDDFDVRFTHRLIFDRDVLAIDNPTIVRPRLDHRAT